MITPGTVVMDVFHTKFLLTRLRDPRMVASGPDRMKKVSLYQAEVDQNPHMIQHRDRLVGELIGLSGTLYEDARRAHADGFPDHVADQGLDLSHAMSMRALDHLDVMATLASGEYAASRVTALRAGVGYNQTVGLLEFGRYDDARGHIAALRSELDQLAGDSEPALASISGFVRDIEHLVYSAR